MLTRVNFIPGLLPVLLQGFRRLLPGLTQQLLSPSFCSSHRYLSWLPPPIAPYPSLDWLTSNILLQFPASGRDSSPDDCQYHVEEYVLVASNKTGNEGHTAQNIADWADELGKG